MWMMPRLVQVRVSWPEKRVYQLGASLLLAPESTNRSSEWYQV